MVNTQLLDYIKQQLAQGLSKETIQQNLISAGGWNLSDITEAFSALGNDQSVSLSNSARINRHLIGPIIVFVIILAEQLLAWFLTGKFTTLSIITAFVSAIIYAVAFALVAWPIRHLSKRFGKKWGFISWVLIIIILIASLWYVYRLIYPSTIYEYQGGGITIFTDHKVTLADCISTTDQNEKYVCGTSYAISLKNINICNEVYTEDNFMYGCRDDYYNYYKTGPTDINECLNIENATTTDNATVMNYAAYTYDCFNSLSSTTLNSLASTTLKKDVCSHLSLDAQKIYCVSTVENIPILSSTSSVASANSSVPSTSTNLSSSDISAITTTVNAFKQAFLNNDQQGVLQYSSVATQGTLKISQLNTSFKEITIKQITFCGSSCRPSYYSNNNEVSVTLNTISTSGVSGNMRWGFVEENGIWRFDLGLTMKLTHSI